jgi:hypothetical protein
MPFEASRRRQRQAITHVVATKTASATRRKAGLLSATRSSVRPTSIRQNR